VGATLLKAPDGETLACSARWEQRLRKQGFHSIAGADDAGRGAPFGPVYAAAVVLDPRRPIHGVRDSKMLDPETRARVADRIRQHAISYAVACVEAAEIDRINIYQASRLAIRKAIEALNPACDFLLVDALTIDVDVPQKGLIKGDARVRAIAAASILAKVERDACMVHYDAIFPGYGLAQHKGYPTPEHCEALERLGPTPLHRRSYEPVRLALQRRLL